MAQTTGIENLSLLKKLVSIRRKIHQYPELGNREFKTTAFIKQLLEENSIPTRRLTETGVIGLLKGEKPGKGRCLAFRSDIDALPIQEQTFKPYASRVKNVMHACGHDANLSIMLGAAMILSRRRKEFGGTLKFIFQPNEETSGGAASLIKHGVLRNPSVDAIFGVHVNPWLKPGTVGIKYGEMMAAVDRFTIEIIGCGGHGAYPQLGKDAVVASSQLVLALQSIVSREIDPTEPAVLTIGRIEGGESFNILCQSVKMIGTVRTLNRATRASIEKKIREKVSGICRAFGAQYKIKYENLGLPLRNTRRLAEFAGRSAEKVLGRRSVIILDRPSMGGEDFAEYLEFVPGCFVYIGAGPKKVYSWHHEKFDIDESCMLGGAEVFAEIALDYLR
jgi:amidohydrolase